MFPRFISVPSHENDKFVEFCWFELVLYKSFRDFHRDIGKTTDEIIQNWENFQYTPWHVDRNPIPPEDPHAHEDEDEFFPNLHNDSREHEWEIISGLYKNKFINANEFDMVGFRDCDVMENWHSNFVDEDTSNHAINFITQKQQVNALITKKHTNKCSFKSLGEKQ